MKFKMRMMHFSPKGLSERLSQEISRAQKASCDKIPPAYPCENEKLLFIGVECTGSRPPKPVLDLCNDMSTNRAKFVALYGVGAKIDAMQEIKQILASKDITVVEPVHHCPVRSGMFAGKLADSDIKAALDWSMKVIDSIA